MSSRTALFPAAVLAGGPWRSCLKNSASRGRAAVQRSWRKQFKTSQEMYLSRFSFPNTSRESHKPSSIFPSCKHHRMSPSYPPHFLSSWACQWLYFALSPPATGQSSAPSPDGTGGCLSTKVSHCPQPQPHHHPAKKSKTIHLHSNLPLMMFQPRIRHRAHSPRILLVQLRVARRQDRAHGADHRTRIMRQGLL